MFKKEKLVEDEAPETVESKVEETAYEDSWYRSLKALAERKPDEGEDEEESPED
jgi:hypothetical protein